MLSPLMKYERRARAGRRTAILRAATLITSDGHHVDVKFKDLSLDGFRIEHSGVDLIAGEIVELFDGRSTVRAQLKWITDQEAGGEFLEQAKALD